MFSLEGSKESTSKREKQKKKKKCRSGEMGMLFSKMWTLMMGSKPYKVIIVGLNNAGKTSLLYALQLGKFVQTQPTIGGNVEEVQYRNLHFVRLGPRRSRGAEGSVDLVLRENRCCRSRGR